MSTDILHVWHTAKTCCVERFPAPLFPGTVVTAGLPQECELTFYMTGTQQDRVVFTGLTAEELARSDNTTTGHRLTCACPTVEDLTPLQWLDGSGMVLPNNRARQLVDYKEAGNQPGSAVHLRINRDGFSCAEAGVYTCVVGTNTRTVLVAPIGEWASSCVCRRGFVQESLLLKCVSKECVCAPLLQGRTAHSSHLLQPSSPAAACLRRQTVRGSVCEGRSVCGGGTVCEGRSVCGGGSVCEGRPVCRSSV